MTTTTREANPSDPVRLVMTRVVATVPSWQSLQDVARELAADEVSAVLVADGSRALGLISERDVVGAVAAGRSLDDAQAADMMTSELVWADPDDSIADTASLMLDAGIRHVPVGDGEEAIGIVSARDVLDVLLTSERSRAAAEGTDRGSPVVHFEIGALDGDRSRRFFSQLFGWAIDVDDRTGYGVVRTGSASGIDAGMAFAMFADPDGNVIGLFVES